MNIFKKERKKHRIPGPSQICWIRIYILTRSPGDSCVQLRFEKHWARFCISVPGEDPEGQKEEMSCLKSQLGSGQGWAVNSSGLLPSTPFLYLTGSSGRSRENFLWDCGLAGGGVHGVTNTQCGSCCDELLSPGKMSNRRGQVTSKNPARGTSLEVRWLRFHTPTLTRRSGSVPGWQTRSHMPQLKGPCTLQWKQTKNGQDLPDSTCWLLELFQNCACTDSESSLPWVK